MLDIVVWVRRLDGAVVRYTRLRLLLARGKRSVTLVYECANSQGKFNSDPNDSCSASRLRFGAFDSR